MAIRAVLIDFDGVIRRWEPHWEPDSSTGITGDDVAAAAFEPARLRGVVTGAKTDEQWRTETAEALAVQHGEIAHSVVAEWTSLTGTIDNEMLAVVRDLRTRVPVALITNATTLLESALETLGLTDTFDLVVNSARVGFAKPDAEIFRHAAEGLGVAPDECVFIDDTAGHVEAAWAVGMTAIHFEGAEPLAVRLRELGLLST
jgi:putative hydrolase of the HAD superfamily